MKTKIFGQKYSPAVFCPVCSSSREAPKQRYSSFPATLFLAVLSLLGAAAALLTSQAVCLWIGMGMGMMVYVAYELRTAGRLKKELICPVCRFDPVLYKRAPELAKKRCLDSLKMREDVFLSKWRALSEDDDSLAELVTERPESQGRVNRGYPRDSRASRNSENRSGSRMSSESGNDRRSILENTRF